MDSAQVVRNGLRPGAIGWRLEGVRPPRHERQSCETETGYEQTFHDGAPCIPADYGRWRAQVPAMNDGNQRRVCQEFLAVAEFARIQSVGGESELWRVQLPTGDRQDYLAHTKLSDRPAGRSASKVAPARIGDHPVTGRKPRSGVPGTLFAETELHSNLNELCNRGFYGPIRSREASWARIQS